MLMSYDLLKLLRSVFIVSRYFLLAEMENICNNIMFVCTFILVEFVLLY